MARAHINDSLTLSVSISARQGLLSFLKHSLSLGDDINIQVWLERRKRKHDIYTLAALSITVF